MELSVHHLSPPNTYSYVQEGNLGSTRKFVQNYFLLMCNYQPNSCTTYTNGVWMVWSIYKDLFKRAEKKFLQPECSRCKLGCPRRVFCPFSIPSEYLFLCARRKFGFNMKIRRYLLIVFMYY